MPLTAINAEVGQDAFPRRLVPQITDKEANDEFWKGASLRCGCFDRRVPVCCGRFACSQPNVVFILADNVGYGDLGPYGGGELRGAPTPRIDQLAREGLRLTQFLVEPACTPSRAALMTGQYSIRSGLSLIIIPGTPNTLSARSVTMAQMFKG